MIAQSIVHMKPYPRLLRFVIIIIQSLCLPSSYNYPPTPFLLQVVIFDATNTTEARRQKLVKEFHGRYQYLFIESICNDEAVLERNYRFKTLWSPDYKGMDADEAFAGVT